MRTTANGRRVTAPQGAVPNRDPVVQPKQQQNKQARNSSNFAPIQQNMRIKLNP